MEKNKPASGVEKNPYGYKIKNSDLPSSLRPTVCVAGADVQQFLPLKQINRYEKYAHSELQLKVGVAYKEKTVNAVITSSALNKQVDSTVLAQLKQVGFYRENPVEKWQAFILQLGKFDENDIGASFDSKFLFTVATNSVERYMMIRLIKNEGEIIPDNIFNSIGKWIGSVANANVKEESLSLDKATKVVGRLVMSVASKFENPDKKVLNQQHQFFADARWCSLKQFRSHKLDPLTTKDPLGNTVAHLAILNHCSEVFPHIATKYPALLTTQNIFGNTPLHNLALLRSRQLNAEYFEWKYIWSLPWNFSLKNKKGQTAVEKLCEIGGKDLVQAFQALFDNKEAWQSVKKCHEVSKLLSVALEKFISSEASSILEDEVLRTVKKLIDQGANAKDNGLFNAALKQKQTKLVHYLIESGAEATYDSMTAAFSTKNRAIADIVLQRFDLRTLSQQQLSLLCDNAVDAGWVDVISLLASKGGTVPVSVNNREKTSLPVANLVARMNWQGTLQLNYLCVDAIVATIDKEKQDKLLQSLPEELRAIFHEKELWRWTLFLGDEEKRNRYLQLYRAIAAAQKVAANNTELQISIGDVVFSVKSIWEQDWRVLKNVGLRIWSGKLSEASEDSSLAYEIVHYTKGDPRKSMAPRTISTETNPEILTKITDALGWPAEETYLFLVFCYNGFLLKSVDRNEKVFVAVVPEEIQAGTFFFAKVIHEHIAPPKWYVEFALQVYGIKSPSFRAFKKRRFAVQEEDSSSGSDFSNSDIDFF
jgi:hypothetical protein